MTLSKKSPEEIKTLFNKIAPRYDINNNLISLGLHKSVKKLAINELGISENYYILDACCGTGDIAKFIYDRNPNCRIQGVDFSKKMIELAKKKYPFINFEEGDCTNLNYNSETFDVVTMTFGLRNIPDYTKAIKEIYRVLKPGGQYLHLDFGQKNLFSKVFDKIAGVTIKLFYDDETPYKYLISSKKEFFTPTNLIKQFEQNGFKLIRRKDFLFGIISMQILEKPLE